MEPDGSAHKASDSTAYSTAHTAAHKSSFEASNSTAHAAAHETTVQFPHGSAYRNTIKAAYFEAFTPDRAAHKSSNGHNAHWSSDPATNGAANQTP